MIQIQQALDQISISKEWQGKYGIGVRVGHIVSKATNKRYVLHRVNKDEFLILRIPKPSHSWDYFDSIFGALVMPCYIENYYRTKPLE